MSIFKVNPRRRRQFWGFMFGLIVTVLGYAVLMWPTNEELVSLGPMNTGHENLKCADCHVKSRGSSWQQIQANLMFTFGMRKSPVSFGHEDVDNKNCKSCHDRPNDRHPVHRFLELRFAEVRELIHPENCESCHREHNGVRLVINDTGYCQNCHQDTELKDDPLDVSHDILIKGNQWTTCLQCHDFHGNHNMNTAVRMQDTIPLAAIKDYILGGMSPYGEDIKYAATKTPIKP